MRRHLQQSRGQLVVGWGLALFATAIYLLTLAPTVSFWDCGEFITTNYQLSVGHPPGAPLYQLLAHAFTWFASGDPMRVALCSNALSAVAGGITIMFLYWILLMLFPRPANCLSHCAAVVGSLCYLFCDTAWFSAVESEVYALAVLIAAMTLWAMLRWSRADGTSAFRWLILVAFLLGLGLCVHLLTLLVAPALLLIFLMARGQRTASRRLPLASRILFPIIFFLIGLTPYLIIPIRAHANPPINFIQPATPENLKRYLAREQYEHAPLYPRIWRHRPNDQTYASDWSGGDNESFVGNMRYFFSYQVGYMYLRYLMWNFGGRYNDTRGYGSLHNGQCITGIPPIDRLIVGQGQRPPDSLTHGARQVYYLLPLMLGILGLCCQAVTDKRGFWTVMTLFLFSGIGLAVYLNTPTYEPRERDYAYVLSFFAFAIWIGWGARYFLCQTARWSRRFTSRYSRTLMALVCLLLMGVPALMAAENWGSHDRSNNFVARESARNLLNSCDELAILFTMGDNDTFPLWYAQQVEGFRTDVSVYNVNLLGSPQRFWQLMDSQPSRPVFFSHYAYDEFADLFSDRLQPQGIAFVLLSDTAQPISTERAGQVMMQHIRWTPVADRQDEVSARFLASYWDDVRQLAVVLDSVGQKDLAKMLLDKASAEVPINTLRDPWLIYDIACCYALAGDLEAASRIRMMLTGRLQEELTYYHSMPVGYQNIIRLTIAPREEILDILSK